VFAVVVLTPAAWMDGVHWRDLPLGLWPSPSLLGFWENQDVWSSVGAQPGAFSAGAYLDTARAADQGSLPGRLAQGPVVTARRGLCDTFPADTPPRRR
jgi:hypothetical protein